MAPKIKGVKLTLHELNQELGGEASQPFLPSQSSGIDRERPDRADGDWKSDRTSRIDRDDRRDDQNEAADGDFNWRAGAPSRSSRRDDTGSRRDEFGSRRDGFGSRRDDFGSRRDDFGSRRDDFGSRRPDPSEEQFSRSAMQSRTEIAATSRGSQRGQESRGFESRSSATFDSNRSRVERFDVDFGDVRGSGGVRRATTISTCEPRTLRTGLGSTTNGSAWGKDSQTAGAAAEKTVHWRSKERVDTRPEHLKNRFKRPTTVVEEESKSTVETPEAEESTKAETISKHTTPSSPAEATSPRKEVVSEPIVETKLSSALQPSKPLATQEGARGLLAESEGPTLDRPTAIKDEVSVLEPMVIKKRQPDSSSATSASTMGGPFRPSRRRQEVSTLEELLKKKEAEAEAAIAIASNATVVIDEKKLAYRKNLQEREQKRREEEDKRRQEKEEEEKRQRFVIEKLMTGDPLKMKKLQGNIETGFKSAADGAILLSQFKAVLSSADLESLIPSIVVAKCLVLQAIETLRPGFESPSSMTDKQRLGAVASLVKTLKPTLAFLFSKSGIRRHKIKFLLEIQRLIHAAGFPRASEGLALIEAIWDSLYMQDVVEEQYFEFWFDATDDQTPGRNEVLFQMLGWFHWLQNALEEGQTELDEDDEDDEDDDF